MTFRPNKSIYIHVFVLEGHNFHILNFDQGFGQNDGGWHCKASVGGHEATCLIQKQCCGPFHEPVFFFLRWYTDWRHTSTRNNTSIACNGVGKGLWHILGKGLWHIPILPIPFWTVFVIWAFWTEPVDNPFCLIKPSLFPPITIRSTESQNTMSFLTD